jgi:primosomal protein N' (replication factor Y) (superfamily II helicase)
VSVPFHGRSLKGWILGPAVEPPGGTLLPIRKVRSPVRFFDESGLGLMRWVAGRYIAPLCTVIERSHPPRVVSEEGGDWAALGEGPKPGRRRGGSPEAPAGGSRPSSPGWSLPAASVLGRGTTTWVRPLPGEEASECVRGVAACLVAGRRAVVIVPEASPVPYTAQAVLEAFGDRAVNFVGGGARKRYRTWLEILGGRYDVVVGTRPAVFAPVSDLGLVWVSREVHPGHREDRSPYYHVREVAIARARLQAAACVLASFSPSVETAVMAGSGEVGVSRPARSAERARAPLVETTPPEAEDRSPRLGRLLREASSAALIVSRAGYGVARVCRACGQPAACSVCRGPIVVEGGSAACRVCGAPGRCANCGSSDFGIERGGVERIAEWSRRVGSLPVDVESGGTASRPAPGRVLVGTAAAVNDVGPVALDLVAILDPDRALARPGVHAGERALATWMEAASWAASRSRGARVLMQSRRPAHPAIQGLVRWEPEPFLRAEALARAEAGFPPGHPVFRIEGTAGLPASLQQAGAESVLATGAEGGSLCLVTVHPDRLAGFRHHVVRLAADGVVVRVEAEPQL